MVFSMSCACVVCKFLFCRFCLNVSGFCGCCSVIDRAAILLSHAVGTEVADF